MNVLMHNSAIYRGGVAENVWEPLTQIKDSFIFCPKLNKNIVVFMSILAWTWTGINNSLK